MANLLTGNFAGTKAQGYLYPAVMTANTLTNNIVETHENVKYKLNLRNLATTGFIADANCDFTANGAVALSDVVLLPKQLEINIQLCKDDFRDQWEALEMKGKLLGQEIPASFQEFFISKIQALTAKDIETTIWQGADATEGQFDGFEALLLADTDVVDVTGTTLDAGNIIGEIGKVYDAITDAVFSQPEDAFIAISIKASKLYQTALAGFGTNGLGANGYLNQGSVGAKPMDYNGVRLVVCNGLSANKMVATVKGNLHFGTNVLTDMNEVIILDMTMLDASQNVRYASGFTAGVQITNPTDIVYYYS